MASPKTTLFDLPLQQAAAGFKALAHPARLAILQYLAQSGKCITAEIADELPLTRTTINQHLEELKKAELIIAHHSSGRTYYCLNPVEIEKTEALGKQFLTGLSENYCCEP